MKFLDLDGLHCIYHIMEQHGDNLRLQQQAMFVLSAVAADNGVLQVLGAGAVPALLHVISNKKTDGETLFASLEALGKIASNRMCS